MAMSISDNAFMELNHDEMMGIDGGIFGNILAGLAVFIGTLVFCAGMVMSAIPGLQLGGAKIMIYGMYMVGTGLRHF